MRDRDGNAQQQHRGEVGRQRAGGLADGEGDGEAEQQGLARQRFGGERQQRAANGDAAGIAGDEIAGGGHRNTKPLRHLRQHAGNDEFGGAESEGGNEQGNERKRHGEGLGWNGLKPRMDGAGNPEIFVAGLGFLERRQL